MLSKVFLIPPLSQQPSRTANRYICALRNFPPCFVSPRDASSPPAKLYLQIETETLPAMWMKQTNWPMPRRIAATWRLGWKAERKAIAAVRVGVAVSAWQPAALLREQVLVLVRWLYHASHPLAKQHPILCLIVPIPILRMATNRKIVTTRLDWPWRYSSHPPINTQKRNNLLLLGSLISI